MRRITEQLRRTERAWAANFGIFLGEMGSVNLPDEEGHDVFSAPLGECFSKKKPGISRAGASGAKNFYDAFFVFKKKQKKYFARARAQRAQIENWKNFTLENPGRTRENCADARLFFGENNKKSFARARAQRGN